MSNGSITLIDQESLRATLLDAQEATSNGVWIEAPPQHCIRSYQTTGLESDGTIEIMVSSAETKPENASDGAVAHTITSSNTIVTKTEAYRWVKAKKTGGASPTATTVNFIAARNRGVAGNVNLYSLQTSISSGNLTVSLKTASGNNATTGDSITIPINGVEMEVTAALSVAVNSAYGDVFTWDGGKIQTNDAQLFVFLINNNGTLQLGVSPYPNHTVIATNYYDDGGQTGSAKYRNIVMSGTRNATNSCTNIGRVNVHQNDDNTWQLATTALVINRPVYETDWLTWSPTYSASASMTWTSVTATVAKYKCEGDNVKILLNAAGTTGGTASTTLKATMPIDNSSIVSVLRETVVFDTSTKQSLASLASAGGILTASWIKWDASNYGLGSGRWIYGWFFYDI